MAKGIISLSLAGFKSIQQMDLTLGDLNILIGANGAGKSNFVDFFRLVRAIADDNLAGFIQKQGGADGFFHLGPQYTREITATIRFVLLNSYGFKLEPTAADGLLMTGQTTQYGSPPEEWSPAIKEESGSGLPLSFAGSQIARWVVYHFHDTSFLAPMRRDQSARDFEYLRPDASNIAAYLLRLRSHEPDAYALIRDTIRLVVPFFDDFRLRPEERGGEEKVRLEWNQKGSDFPFQPSQLSDGTIRFICLATALLQPMPPSTLVIDEPELGLHPHALEVLAGLLKKAAARGQVIVSTQSAPLLSQFDTQDVIVVSRTNGASHFERLVAQDLASWLDEYTLGELWQKNYIEGASNG